METQNYFDKPFEAMSTQELKTAIKSKFTNIARFCRLTGRDVYTFNKLMRLKRTPANVAELEAIYNDAKRTDNGPADNELDAPARKKIKSAIFAQSENILDFCESHGFSNTWVSTVLNGGVQKVTPKVKELLGALNLDLSQPQPGKTL